MKLRKDDIPAQMMKAAMSAVMTGTGMSTSGAMSSSSGVTAGAMSSSGAMTMSSIKHGDSHAPMPPPTKPYDKTGWILDSSYADFVLMHTYEIKFFCLLGYTFLHGSKLFGKTGSPQAKQFMQESTISYKFALMCFKCTGGGYVRDRSCSFVCLLRKIFCLLHI
jgi:hypothetical protein